MTPQFPKSLPPLVDGDVYGQLKVTIDEIIWLSKSLDEVNVLMQWWGDSENVILRPVDVSKFPESAEYGNNSVTYEIQTNLQNFESYLKQCNKLSLLIVKNSSKEIVGHVEVEDLLSHITGIQYQKYFSIITSSGLRLGDLRVDFDLSMSSVPEESTSKKKKRSRKKNKLHSTLQLAEEDHKSKPMKKGCLTCSEHKKPSKAPTMKSSLALKLPKPPVNLNTERSDTSDCVLLDMLEKGKKLRDAMMLSVLEDIDTVLDDDLEFKLDQPENNSKGYKSLKKTKNGKIVSPHEEQLINDYLEGKNMKEEEEILVLNTLHVADKQLTSKNNASQHHPQNSDSCCLTSKSGCSHTSLHNSETTYLDNTSSLTTQSSSVVGSDVQNNWINKVNCFRLTIDNLTLTKAGWKKIDQAVDKKSKSGDSIPPPRATYFVECHFVEESPRSQFQQSKSTPLRFCSRKQIENVIYFCQSSAHSLRKTGAVADELTTTTCLVCWRHLNQRVPALLGHFSLASLVSTLTLDTTASVPVKADNGTVTAYMHLRLELGKDKLHFGRLIEDNLSVPSDGKKMAKEGIVRFKEAPLVIEELNDKDQLHENDDPGKNEELISEKPTSLPNYDSIPVCKNCDQNLVLTNLPSSTESVLCVSCTKLFDRRQVTFKEPNFKISIPKNFSSKEHRIHQFMLGIDTVKGFPLFAGINEELSCYVDYKFPEITSNLKAEMGRCEATSHVIGCQVQPVFSSVQRHKLVLPVVLPLSPLLAACSPGVTLRLWLRYYKPTPRDHMVAMALLPMDELCLMELEFDKNPYKTAVIKVLELPLALVPSSVTAPYQQQRNVGSLRVSVNYSNVIFSPASRCVEGKDRLRLTNQLPSHAEESDFSAKIFKSLNACSVEKQGPRNAYPHFQYSNREVEVLEDEDEEHYHAFPFKSGSVCKGSLEEVLENQYLKVIKAPKSSMKESKNEIAASLNNSLPLDQNVTADDHEKNNNKKSSDPVVKEEFEMLTENLEKTFNQLQSDLFKERQRGIIEVDSFVTDLKKASTEEALNNSEEDFLAIHSLTSSMDSTPFILGPPAHFGDLQNTVVFSKTENGISDTQSENSSSHTISGFFAEEKEEANFNSNESIERRDPLKESTKPKTFKVKVKIDRAVNLKAVKGASNGKKSKVPPSTWVSFGSGGCCELNCDTSNNLVCTGQKFSTPVIRRSYNPIWNLAWEVDLPLEYLQQVDKRLVFRVFEENLDAAFGFASANLSILTTGLPSLSSWLSINDFSGSCKGQIKVVITPLEDLSKYQECPVYDPEEEEFEEMKNNIPDSLPLDSKTTETTAFVASQTEVFVCESETSENSVKEDSLKSFDPDEDIGREDPVLADDIINDYKNTLENNFKNEMAGLENLIKFLRVGSSSNEISFLRSNENKENSNPTLLPTNSDSRTSSTQDISGKISGRCSSSGNQSANLNGIKERILIDATTETMNREVMPSSSGLNSSEDILSRLLQQISMFQLPTVKIADNTSQTFKPETKESFTETVIENHSKPVQTKTIHLKDACTETEDLNNKPQPSQLPTSSVGPHVCGELGSVLQHFLTCRPAPIKTCDSSCQTAALDTLSSTNSSGLLARSLPSGMSCDVQGENRVEPTHSRNDWISSEEAHSNCERLIAIDNNIKDLEKFLKENLMFTEKTSIPSLDLKEESLCGSVNGTACSMQDLRADNENSTSDIESLEHFSDRVDVPRETPDGGDIASDLLDLTLDSDTDNNTATTMRRRGTFVIDKTSDNSKSSSSNKG